MKYSLSAAAVAISREASKIFPRCVAVGGDDLEAVKQRCRHSHERWGHCEIPYPAGDIRRDVWVEEMARINAENEPIPFPLPPAPVPEEEQDDGEELPAAAKKLVNRECEHVRI